MGSILKKKILNSVVVELHFSSVIIPSVRLAFTGSPGCGYIILMFDESLVSAVKLVKKKNERRFF